MPRTSYKTQIAHLGKETDSMRAPHTAFIQRNPQDEVCPLVHRKGACARIRGVACRRLNKMRRRCEALNELLGEWRHFWEEPGFQEGEIPAQHLS